MPAYVVEYNMPGRRGDADEDGHACGLAAEDYPLGALALDTDVGALVVRPMWGTLSDVIFAEVVAPVVA